MRRRSLIMLAASALLAAACSSPAATGGSTPAPSPTTDAETAPPTPSPSAASSIAVACSVAEEPGAVTVAIKDYLFVPAVVEIDAGETVTFTNGDTAPHNATLDDESCGTKGLLKDWSEGLTLTEPGTYGYFCSVHPEMKATIEVR